MDTREHEGDGPLAGISLEESLGEFEKIERQYDLLEEELGFSLSSEPTREEQRWISPREGDTSPRAEGDAHRESEEPSVSSDIVSSSTDKQPEIVAEEAVDEKSDSVETEPSVGLKSKEESKDNISTTISKVTPTRDIDLLKELEMMEQEVSTMKKVVDEVEANVESRKAKIAELVDSATSPESSNSYPSEQFTQTVSEERTQGTVTSSEEKTDTPSVSEEKSYIPYNVTNKPVEIARYFPVLEDEQEPKAMISGVTTSESTTDDVVVAKSDEEVASPLVNVAGVTTSESNTDAEFPSSESDAPINEIMTKSLSQTFDLVSLQSLQENVKSEPFSVKETDVCDKPSKSAAAAPVAEQLSQRPTTFGAEELLTRDAPLASVESEVDDELMKTSSSNTSPDDPVGGRTDDTSKDLDEEPDSTTSESVVESSVKSEVKSERTFTRFRDTFPMHVSTIAHITPEPPKLIPVPEKKKPDPYVRVQIPAVKPEAKPEPESKVQKREEARPTTSREIRNEQPRKGWDVEQPPASRQKGKEEPAASRATRQPAGGIPTLGQKLKVERHDGRPRANEHGLKPVEPAQREKKRSRSPADMGLVPAAGGGLQAIGEMVAAAARCRSKLSAAIETEAIKRIDNLLSSARDRRARRQDSSREPSEARSAASSGSREPEERRREREPVSPAASAAASSTGPQSPPSAARASVAEHMEALDQLVRESQAAADITIDESFVNTRDRKKRKRNQSNKSDSSFTISTPSGSIKSCSSISEIESAPNSHGLSLDKSNSADILGSSTDADVSLSADLLLDEGTTVNDSNTTVISDTTLERRATDSANKDSVTFQSANTTVADNSNSEYYTPNTSGVEPMDTTNEIAKSSPKPVNRPKALDSRSTASDGKSVDSLEDSQGSPLHSPRRNLLDAKRNFFFEPAKPVYIEPSRVFNSPTRKMKKSATDNGGRDRDGNALEVGSEEFENRKNANNAQNHQGSPSKRKIGVDPELLREWKSIDEETTKKGVLGLDLKRDWQSLDSGAATSPTAGVPKTNVTNGDSDVFYTPGTSLKHPPIMELRADNGLRKPTDTKRRILPELRKFKESDRETARQVAREKARLKSDEELGLDQLSPTRKAAYTKDEMVANGDRKTGTKKDHGQKESGQDSSTKRSSGFFDNYPPLEPEIPCKVSIIGGSVHEAKTRSLQNKATAAAMADYLLQSPQSSQSKSGSKDKRSKSKSPMRAAAEMSSPPNLQKQDSREDKKESKEKRRSLLALLLPSKSVEKKEKKLEKEKKSSTPKQSKSKSPPIKKQETKSKGLKSPKTSTSPKVPGISDQSKKGTDATDGQKASVYEELRPVIEENAFSDKKDGKGKVESKKEKLLERIEQVAPTVSNDKTIAPKLPPRATGESSLFP